MGMAKEVAWGELSDSSNIGEVVRFARFASGAHFAGPVRDNVNLPSVTSPPKSRMSCGGWE
jgi:hypothetical protein